MEVLNFRDSIDDNLKIISLFCNNLASGLMFHEMKLFQEPKKSESDKNFQESENFLESLMKILDAKTYAFLL